MNYTLSDSTFTQLADLIKEKTGINIPPTKKYLVENRLFKILEDYNLKSFDEYLYMLKYNSNGEVQNRLFDAITTNETYFFREPMQFDVFMDHIVPKIIESKGGSKHLRIWNAACSSGEEPYTLSMMLKERRPDIMAEIHGTDISRKVIDSATNGQFSSYSIRNVPEPYMSKYFTQQGDTYALDSKIKNSVRFRMHNLLTCHRSSETSNLDLAFCRNVLIYFDNKTKQQAVSCLYDSLRPGGFLIIGSSESLHNVTRAFKPVTINRVIIYEKV
jgi:chemotaxis protein methyltransferase CheR